MEWLEVVGGGWRWLEVVGGGSRWLEWMGGCGRFQNVVRIRYDGFLLGNGVCTPETG